jgi:hypothetical protein
MQCPVCNCLRYSRSWKPSQWAAYSAVINDFNCCKECSADGYTVAAGEQENSFAELAEVWCRLELKAGLRDKLLLVVQEWMSNIDHKTRKNWSHFGALRKRSADDSTALVPWSSADASQSSDDAYDKTAWFDPGNHCYWLVFKALWPTYSLEWNKETVGDIFESMLGLHYLATTTIFEGRAEDKAFLLRTNIAYIAVCRFLHDFCYAVFRYLRSTRWVMAEGSGEPFLRFCNFYLPKACKVPLEVD